MNIYATSHDSQILKEHYNLTNIIETSEFYEFEPISKTPKSILIMRDFITSREPQEKWFERMISDVLNNTDQLLVIIGGVLADSTHQELYRKVSDKIQVHYFTYLAFPTPNNRHVEKYYQIKKLIEEFSQCF
jgi:hypothetical protein